jgi:hypothetical protein
MFRPQPSGILDADPDNAHELADAAWFANPAQPTPMRTCRPILVITEANMNEFSVRPSLGLSQMASLGG